MYCLWRSHGFPLRFLFFAVASQELDFFSPISVKVPPKCEKENLEIFQNEFSFKISTNSTLNRMASWRYLSRMG
jgi:hypothetical protein